MRVTLLVAFTIALLAPAGSDPQQIVFSRVFPNAGQLGLFIASADGTGERPLLTVRDLDYNPTWSPDDRSIVFTSDREGSADLFRVNPDGNGLERLTDDPAYDDQAAFSPDGKQLVFVSSRDGGFAHLWTMDIASRRATRLTSGDGGDFRPSWSPDGSWIAFSSDRGSTLPFAHGRWEHLQLVDLYVVRPDGNGLKRISEPGGFCGSPKWAQDSRHVIAYCMNAELTLNNRRASPVPGSDTRLVSIDITTGVASAVRSGPGVKFNPAFVGSTVAYIRKDRNGASAGIYYADGRKGPEGDVRTAAWSRDGDSVVFHKRLTIVRKPWVRTWSRNPGYELTLTNQQPSFNPTGDRFTTVGGGAQAPQPPLGAGIVISRMGSDATEVIYRDATRNVLGPQWSPSGDAIVFGIGTFNAFFNGFNSLFLAAADRVEGGAQVAMVRPDGTGFRELTSGRNNNGFPSMAPDGKRFVYRTFGPEGNGLRVKNIDTGAVTTLTEGYDNFPLWSPRGDLIMFSRQADGDYEIYSIKPDGTGLKRLTHARGNDAHMAWSPDGEQIAFASTRMGFKDEMTYTDAPQPYGEIFVMRYDGTKLEQLTDDQWEDGTPAFVPVKRQGQ